VIDRFSAINGVHTVYNNAAEGYEYLESNSYVYLLTERASEAVINWKWSISFIAQAMYCNQI
jgi:hypothetical protein